MFKIALFGFCHFGLIKLGLWPVLLSSCISNQLGQYCLPKFVLLTNLLRPWYHRDKPHRTLQQSAPQSRINPNIPELGYERRNFWFNASSIGFGLNSNKSTSENGFATPHAHTPCGKQRQISLIEFITTQIRLPSCYQLHSSAHDDLANRCARCQRLIQSASTAANQAGMPRLASPCKLSAGNWGKIRYRWASKHSKS